MMTTHAITIVAQDKTWSYIEWRLRNDFIPLAIETNGCFHPRFDSFFISCVHANIVRHQLTSLHYNKRCPYTPNDFTRCWMNWLVIVNETLVGKQWIHWPNERGLLNCTHILYLCWYFWCLYFIIGNDYQYFSNVHKPLRFFNKLPHLSTIFHLFHTYQLMHLHH